MCSARQKRAERSADDGGEQPRKPDAKRAPRRGVAHLRDVKAEAFQTPPIICSRSAMSKTSSVNNPTSTTPDHAPCRRQSAERRKICAARKHSHASITVRRMRDDAPMNRCGSSHLRTMVFSAVSSRRVGTRHQPFGVVHDVKIDQLFRRRRGWRMAASACSTVELLIERGEILPREPQHRLDSNARQVV